MNVFLNNGITILDSTMGTSEIRLLKSIRDVLGFEVTNETGTHVFLTVTFNIDGSVKRLLITQ